MDNDRIGPLCYVRQQVRDVVQAANFLEETVGLQRSGERDGEIRLRADARDHAIALSVDDRSGIGIELDSELAIEEAAARLNERGLSGRYATTAECVDRATRAAYLTNDATGNAIDLLFRPFVRGSRFFPARDSRVGELKNVGLRSTDIAADSAIWTDILGATVTDWVGDVTYLRLGSEHHSIALYPSDRPGIVYFTFAVEEFDDLMRNYHFLRSRQIEIAQGPGRETVSGQRFIRFLGPEGLVVGFGQGMAAYGSGRRPRQFTRAALSFCDLGSEASNIPELATHG